MKALVAQAPSCSKKQALTSCFATGTKRPLFDFPLVAEPRPCTPTPRSRAQMPHECAPLPQHLLSGWKMVQVWCKETAHSEGSSTVVRSSSHVCLPAGADLFEYRVRQG